MQEDMLEALKEELEIVVKLRQRLQDARQEVEDAIYANSLLQDELEHESRPRSNKQSGTRAADDCMINCLNLTRCATASCHHGG